MQEKSQQDMAMFRFGLIAPVINGTYTEPSKMAYYRNVVSNPLELPDGSKVTYSANTLSWWELAYRKGGFDALCIKGRRDKGYSRKLSQEAMDAIVALRRTFPRINAVMIRERLIEEGTIDAKDVSLSTIQRFVRLRKDIIATEQKKIDRKAFEAERVFELWQADTMYGPYVSCPSGRKERTYLVSAIDDKSRLIVASRFYAADNALNFQRVLKEGISRFGIPEKIYCDNGSTYRNDQLSSICGRLGAVLIHAPVRDGAAKGKIERWHRTVRDRYLSVLSEAATKSLDALNQDFVGWVTKYNTTLHSATQMTPMQCYMRNQDSIRLPKSTQWLNDVFLNTVTRKVKSDATISFEKVTYDVPMFFIGTTVCVRYLPGDLSSVHILHEDKRYQIQATDKCANAKTARNKSQYKVPFTQKGDKDDTFGEISA
jgi:transposase InsO family protein